MQNFVFDLYGTLVDISTDENSQNFWDNFLSYAKKAFGAGEGLKEGYLLQCAAAEGYAEPDARLMLQRAIISSGGEMDERQSYQAAAVFRSLSTRFIKLYRGARELLQYLKRRGAKLYILSNAQASFTYAELDTLKIKYYFDGIELSSRFGYKKPSPAFFAHLVQKYSLDTAKTLFTGNDIFCDILPAKAFGFKTAYYLSDISPQTDSLNLARKYADFASADFTAVSAYIKGELK